MSHALLSPSSAHRWLECNPSARLEETFPDSSGAAAEEGTLAHALGEAILRRWKQDLSEVQFSGLVDKMTKSTYYNEDLKSHAEDYAAYVIEQYEEARKSTKDALLIVEAKLDMREWVPGGFGTGDAVIIADDLMHIIDLKYGKGVRVSCENNKQMMLYALGAITEYDFMYDLRRVRMSIYQPRLDNISSWDISTEELQQWAEDTLKPAAERAFNGDGEYKPGAHCRFCKARNQCKALYEEQMKLAVYDFRDSHLLTDDEISDILNRADSFKKWLSGIEEYALLAAINEGKQWPGYKLVEGRSVRTYADQEAVVKALLAAGYSDDMIYSRSLLGITAMEKLLSKKTFEAMLSPLVIKPAGKPTLAPLDDKRPEYNSTESAKSDFQ